VDEKPYNVLKTRNRNRPRRSLPTLPLVVDAWFERRSARDRSRRRRGGIEAWGEGGNGKDPWVFWVGGEVDITPESLEKKGGKGGRRHKVLFGSMWTKGRKKKKADNQDSTHTEKKDIL